MLPIIPSNDGKLYNLATKNYNGLVKYGGVIPITLLAAAMLLASKTAFLAAANSFNACRKGVRDAYKVYKPAMSELTAWLVKARRSLVGILGPKWSAAWAAAGFVNNTTAVPDSNEARIALGLALQAYYTDNPSSERPDDDVTAAEAASLTAAATAAQTVVAEKEEALKEADDVRQPAKTNLLGLMSSLTTNLNDKLAPNDPRWLAFGLPMPATPTTPGKPQNVTATLNADGSILVQWNPEPLAGRYRGRMMILGVDTKYRLAFSGPETMGLITGIQPGATVSIIVQAVNGNSQGVASAPVNITIPLTVAQEATAKPAISDAALLAPLTAIAPLSNGNGNGSHAVSRLS